MNIIRQIVLVASFATAINKSDALLILRGTVQDDVGAFIPGAHIILRKDLAGYNAAPEPLREIVTNQSGAYSQQVSEGFYDVCVMVDMFQPQCRKVSVEKHSVAANFHLKVSPEVEKLHADPVY